MKRCVPVSVDGPESFSFLRVELITCDFLFNGDMAVQTVSSLRPPILLNSVDFQNYPASISDLSAPRGVAILVQRITNNIFLVVWMIGVPHKNPSSDHMIVNPPGERERESPRWNSSNVRSLTRSKCGAWLVSRPNGTDLIQFRPSRWPTIRQSAIGLGPWMTYHHPPPPFSTKSATRQFPQIGRTP